MDGQVLLYIFVGFIAQMIDGSLGMGYGVTSTSFLLAFGVSPAIASASVHSSEVVTTLVSGLSHKTFGNVDSKLFRRLLIPGMAGAFIGACLLAVIPTNTIKPYISGYLLIMGVVIVYKVFKKAKVSETPTKIVPLGLIGGFFDAIGGGGWGPIVTSTLVAKGNEPHITIGTVNAAEFFVTVVEAMTLAVLLKTLYWKAIIGLIVGGVVAAPLAAYTCRKIPVRILMGLVGILIIALSIRTIYLALA
jgi:uncharacterized membrane protein YfcA